MYGNSQDSEVYRGLGELAELIEELYDAEL